MFVCIGDILLLGKMWTVIYSRHKVTEIDRGGVGGSTAW